MACFHNESVQELRLFLLFAIYPRFLRNSFKEDLYFFVTLHILYLIFTCFSRSVSGPIPTFMDGYGHVKSRSRIRLLALAAIIVSVPHTLYM